MYDNLFDLEVVKGPTIEHHRSLCKIFAESTIKCKYVYMWMCLYEQFTYKKTFDPQIHLHGENKQFGMAEIG